MPKVFISYRRSDSAGHAGRIHDRLAKAVGHDNVFQDVEDISPGKDFEVAIEDAMAQCEIQVVVIGPRFLDDINGPRLRQAEDHLRQEIAAGLRSARTKVVPVRVAEARLPSADDLPPDLAKLPLRQDYEVRDRSFAGDLNDLVKALGLRRYPPQLLIGGGIAAAVALVVVLIAIFSGNGNGDGNGVAEGTTTTEPTTTTSTSTVVPARPFTLDSYVGLGAGAAQASLESQGLAVQTRIESSPDVPEGDVIRQDPSAGSEVLSGATVQLVVSDGPAPVLIPETAAILRDTAVSRLEREGLRVSVTLVASGVVNVDRVIRTELAAGTSVQFGSSVELLVSSGPASACSTLFPNNFASIGFDGSLSVGSDGLPTGFEPAIFQAVIEQMCGTTVQSEFSILESAERFEAVQTGRVDILPTSQISRFFGLLYTTPYVLLNGENPPAFAIRGGLNLERGQVNAALLELIESGRWRELHLEWLGEPSYTVNQMLETPLLEE